MPHVGFSTKWVCDHRFYFLSSSCKYGRKCSQADAMEKVRPLTLLQLTFNLLRLMIMDIITDRGRLTHELVSIDRLKYI